jgi:hypothetical protein
MSCGAQSAARSATLAENLERSWSATTRFLDLVGQCQKCWLLICGACAVKEESGNMTQFKCPSCSGIIGPPETTGQQSVTTALKAAPQSSSPAASSSVVSKASAPREPTTLIQWILLPVPEELQRQEEQKRMENIKALMQYTVNHVTNTFKGLRDWSVQMVRDGSVVSFSCQCPDQHDPFEVKKFLDATWDHYCKQASGLLKKASLNKQS